MADVIVVGIDGSDSGTRAAQFAASRVGEAGGRLLVAYVIPWSPYAFTTAEENERRPVQRKAEIAAAHEHVVDPLLEQLRAAGVEVEGVVRHGHPAETLASLAKEHGAAHIVVGRTGQSKVRTLLFGSTPSNLIQLSSTPVTVVP